VRRETGLASLTGTAGDYNWGGAYGTAFWIDPKEQLIVVSMTQAPGPIRVHYRQLLKTFVLQAIDDSCPDALGYSWPESLQVSRTAW
jgi:CubicO group peptidase (beta-lactamase class C family)